MKRLVTAVGLIAFAVYLVWLAPHSVFVAGAILMALLCYWEYSGLVAAHGIPRPGVIGVLAGLWIFFLPGEILPGISILIIVALVFSLRRATLPEILPQVACEFFGTLYTFIPWRFAVDLRNVSVHLLFFSLALNWAGDTAAYYAGRRFGKHRLAPIVSPKKSWEGAAASVIASLVLGVLYLGKFERTLPGWEVALMAVAGNIAGQLGDLAESAIKRGAGVKDSGGILPGHGGVLDRVDSSLFALPAVYGIYLLIRILSY
jgi:phosphatidate cytidylyltransferase